MNTLIDISQPTLLTPIRVMVDAEDGMEIQRLSLLDAEGREWLRYAFPAINGFQQVWAPSENLIITFPIRLGPTHNCGYTQITTIDATENRTVRRWNFPRVTTAA